MKTLPLLCFAALLLFPGRAAPAESPPPDLIDEARDAYFQGDLERSLRLYGGVSEKDPRYPEALQARAVLFTQLGKLNEALRETTRLDYYTPESASVHRAMGWLFFSQESYNRAIHFFKKSLDEDPGSWESRMGLAWAHAKQNDFKEALALYQSTLSRFPDAAIVYYLAGRLFERMENEKSALTLYQKALAKDPSLTEAKAAWDALTARLEGRRADIFWLRRLLRAVPGSGSLLRGFRLVFQRPSEPFLPETAAERLREPAPLFGKDETKQKLQVPFYRKKVPLVRIGLGTDRLGRPFSGSTVTITCSGDFEIFEGTEAVKKQDGLADDPWTVGRNPDGVLCRILPSGSRQEITDRMIAFVPYDPEATFTVRKTGGDLSDGSGGTRRYKGILEVHLSKAGVFAVNQVPMADYLASVVPAEISPIAPLESMKAQAVLSRSLAVVGRFHENGYDLCDDQHCQVYRGAAAETEPARTAVLETDEEVMVHRGRVAHTVYSSNCGGRTISGSELEKWGGAPYWKSTFDGPAGQAFPSDPAGLESWIKGVPPVFCRPSKHTATSEFRWTRIVSAQALQDRLKKDHPDLGKVLGIVVRRRARSGHALTVEIVGSRRRVTLDQEHRIRYLLAPGSLRSTLFFVQTVQEAGRPSLFLFWGGGWGHGVGLCQSGAMGMARANKKYTEILEHYYPDCHIGKLQE